MEAFSFNKEAAVIIDVHNIIEYVNLIHNIFNFLISFLYFLVFCIVGPHQPMAALFLTYLSNKVISSHLIIYLISYIYFKGARSRYFESFSATCKITFSVKETTKYWFGKIEKHQNGKNKPKRNEGGEGWRILRKIANDQREKMHEP